MQYLFEETADGSPTLRLKSELKDSSEAMHSTKGAFAETVYIYGEAALRTLQENLQPSFLSIGLGLGYVEIVISALALQKGCLPHVTSFEADSVLRENFVSWLQDRPLDDAFSRAYNAILERTCQKFTIPQERLKQAMQESFREKRLEICEAFNLQNFPPRRYSCLCFDAFSSNSSPELWTAELLDRVCAELTLETAYFATYASTGHLKRALQAHGFVLVRGEGFGGKRESTLARKGL